MLNEGGIGVHPPGALGVAFFVHAEADCFVGRGGDGITQPLKEAGALNLDDHGRLRSIPLKDRILANLLEAEESNLEIKDGKIEIEVKPFEIITLKMNCDISKSPRSEAS